MSEQYVETVIIGAGPVGLFQIFELGLLGISTHIIDSLGQPGGQCTELYPDKPIYDIPALPVCGAQELIDRLLEQAKPFKATFHLGQEVTELRVLENGKFHVATSTGTRLTAGAVVGARGVHVDAQVVQGPEDLGVAAQQAGHQQERPDAGQHHRKPAAAGALGPGLGRSRGRRAAHCVVRIGLVGLRARSGAGEDVTDTHSEPPNLSRVLAGIVLLTYLVRVAAQFVQVGQQRVA